MEQLNRMQRDKSQISPEVNLEQVVKSILAGYRTIKINLEGLSVQYAESLAKTRGLR